MSRVTGWARWGREEDTRCVWRSLDAAFVDACITQGCRRKTSAERSTFNPPTTNPMRLLVQIWKHEEAWSLRRKRKQINKWCFVSTPMMQKVCSAFVKHVKNKHPCAYRFAGITPTVLWISAKLKCHSSIRAHTQQKKRHTNIYQKKALTVSAELTCCWCCCCHFSPVSPSLSQQGPSHTTGLGSASCASVEPDRAPWTGACYCWCSDAHLRRCGSAAKTAGRASSSGCSCGSASSSRLPCSCPAVGPGSPGWPGLAASRAPRYACVASLKVWPGSQWCY